MFNPFFIYIYSYLIVIVFYQLNWSYKFPKLSGALIVFLLFSGFCNLILGFIFKSQKATNFYKVKYEKKYDSIAVAIYVGYLIEFAYFKNIPGLSLLFGTSGTLYKDFGIPVFHVLLVTFNSFFVVYLFHVLLSSQKKKKLILLIVTLLVPSVLIANRGMLAMTLVSCLFLYLFKMKKINLRITFFILIGSLLFLYLFGLFGNIRVNNSYGRLNDPFDNSVIFSVGGANNSFMENKIVPKPYFWTYIYVSSPLANFQETINLSDTKNSNISELPRFINNQFIPDFIGKRINSLYNWTKPDFYQISQELNVGTIYASSYKQLGWFGVLFLFFYLIVFSITYIILISKLKSPFYLTAVAILSTMFLFNTFSNMLTFSGLSFQLVYPIIFELFKVTRKRLNKAL